MNSFLVGCQFELKRGVWRSYISHTCGSFRFTSRSYLPGLLGQEICDFAQRGRFQSALDRKENDNSDKSDESSWASGNSSVTVVPRRWLWVLVACDKFDNVQELLFHVVSLCFQRVSTSNVWMVNLAAIVIMIGTAC